MADPDRLRRSVLSVPGSNPKMIAKAAASEADVAFVDLENAVAPSEKPAARAHAVTGAAGVLDVVVVPKVRSPRDVWFVNDLLTQLELKLGLAVGNIGVDALIEDAVRCSRWTRSPARASGWRRSPSGSATWRRASRCASATSARRRHLEVGGNF